jgi:DNA ligase-1
MRAFAELYDAIDRTTSTNKKVSAMAAYFTTAPPANAAWALYFLTGRRLKRLLRSGHLHEWTMELSGLPSWLLEESYGAVGDFAETIALVVSDPARGEAPPDLPLAEWIEERLVPLRNSSDREQRERVTSWWRTLERAQLFLLNKLLTGEFRVGVSQTLVMRAVAQAFNLPVDVVAHRLMGFWYPSAEFFERLRAQSFQDADLSRPYPFFLASPIEEALETRGAIDEWLLEWKWDGIRAQIVRRGADVFIWSRGEELVTDRFPEVREAARSLPPGTVIDGEIVAYRNGRVQPFALLQRRIGRERLSAAILTAAPVALLAYDLLEDRGADIRERPLSERRARLIELLEGRSDRLPLSEALSAASWDEAAALRNHARAMRVEGLMLKRWSSPYLSGRRRGHWWKWKVDPLTIDAVLVYAQPGSGRRASLLTDLTFAVWDQGELHPVAKAYSGLSDEEILELDRWIRRHTTERFGPVRGVEPTLVFELAFDRVAASTRHKSGVAVRFPRIARWRRDKPAAEADTLEQVRALIDVEAPKAHDRHGVAGTQTEFDF